MNLQTSTPDYTNKYRYCCLGIEPKSLEQGEQKQVEKHIAHCLLCRRELISLRKLKETVTRGSDWKWRPKHPLPDCKQKCRQRPASFKQFHPLSHRSSPDRPLHRLP